MPNFRCGKEEPIQNTVQDFRHFHFCCKLDFPLKMHEIACNHPWEVLKKN